MLAEDKQRMIPVIGCPWKTEEACPGVRASIIVIRALRRSISHERPKDGIIGANKWKHRELFATRLTRTGRNWTTSLQNVTSLGLFYTPWSSILEMLHLLDWLKADDQVILGLLYNHRMISFGTSLITSAMYIVHNVELRGQEFLLIKMHEIKQITSMHIVIAACSCQQWFLFFNSTILWCIFYRINHSCTHLMSLSITRADNNNNSDWHNQNTQDVWTWNRSDCWYSSL